MMRRLGSGLKRPEFNFYRNGKKHRGDKQYRKLEFPGPAHPFGVAHHREGQGDEEQGVGGEDHVGKAVSKVKGKDRGLPGDAD